ncbi:MAG: alpha/beta fold hydrolase [Gammaproteobacteria bacterium]|nr:alpha/beta fold hydrolase [Gammaproteobacteria bacterium]
MQLNYCQYSTSGEPVLILHGLFGSHSNWGWHAKELAVRFAVTGVDLRNHGGSPHAETMNYQIMAEDIQELLQRLDIESCFIIGHSMGGKVAMELSLSYPQLVSKMIVVDIAPVAYESSADAHMRVIAGMDSLDLEKINSRIEAEDYLRDFIHDESTRQFVLTNLVREKSGGYRWRLNLPAIKKEYDNLRGEPSGNKVFRKPVLFIKGALSNYIKAEHEQQILKFFPKATSKIIMGGGHWLHAEKPQAFNKIAMGFLS